MHIKDRISLYNATAIKTDEANPREKEALNLRRGENVAKEGRRKKNSLPLFGSVWLARQVVLGKGKSSNFLPDVYKRFQGQTRSTELVTGCWNFLETVKCSRNKDSTWVGC
jgi:hypothetical protein